MTATIGTLVAAAVLMAASAQAGQASSARTDGSVGVIALPAGYDGPAPPVPPEVVTRDATGRRATLRAVRINSPMDIDGKLDEEVYRLVPSISDFIQQEPQEGAPATEKTEVWILFDDENVYVMARCWDSQPDRMVMTEMRRDGSRIPRNENLAFGLDPFFDHRSGYNFEFTPVGGVMDSQISNDGVTNDSSWNGVWHWTATTFEQGWMVESRIPFKSLRYRPGPDQVWAIQVRRRVVWKNELSYITQLPRSIGERGHMRVSLAPALVGLEVPPPAKNLEFKPWVVSSLSTDKTVNPTISNDGKGDFGVDLKYGITKSLTADFTYNTDFAQVEADQQQVNLTRFSLFFPERRDFFLENAQAFYFNNTPGAANDDTPALFYSRRIGLSGSQAVPIVAGARTSGRVGKYTVGLLNIQSDSIPDSQIRATNFSVARVKRDILRRSYVGALFAGRSVSQRGEGTNQTYGVDAGLNLKTNLTIEAYLAKTQTTGRDGPDTSYKGSFDYAGDRYGAQFEYLTINPDFNPEVGFVARADMRRTFGQFRFSPRPANRSSWVRRYHYVGSVEDIRSASNGRVENETYTGQFAIDLQNSDRMEVTYSEFSEFLPTSLSLGRGVVVPSGSYDYRSVVGGYNFGSQRKLFSTNTSMEYGSFYDGDKTSIRITGGAISWPPHLIVEPSYTFNKIDVPQGTLTQNLIGPRIAYGFTPRAFLSTLIQYNSATNSISSNVRLRWEYRPGSDVFVVWNEQHDTFTGGLPLQARALVVKFNHLFRL